MFVGPDFLITLPNEPLQTIDYLFERCRANEELRESLFSKGPGYLLYKIVDDCVDASFPMLGKIGNKLERIEEEIFEGAGEDVVRDISNAKQEIINFRKIVRPQRLAVPRPRAQQGALHRRGPRHLLRRPDRRFRACLGHARELQGGRRGPRGHQRVGDRAPHQRDLPRPDRDLADLPAADADREPVRHERAPPVGGFGARLLDHHRHDARDRLGRRRTSSADAAGCDRSPRTSRRSSGAERPKTHARDHQPGRDEDDRPGEEPRRLRAPGPLRRHDARDRGQGARDRDQPRGGRRGLRRRRRPSAATARSTRPPTGSPARAPRSPACPAAPTTSSPSCSGSRPTSSTPPSTCCAMADRWEPRTVDLGMVNGRYFTFAAGIGPGRQRGRARRRQPAR